MVLKWWHALLASLILAGAGLGGVYLYSHRGIQSTASTAPPAAQSGPSAARSSGTGASAERRIPTPPVGESSGELPPVEAPAGGGGEGLMSSPEAAPAAPSAPAAPAAGESGSAPAAPAAPSGGGNAGGNAAPAFGWP